MSTHTFGPVSVDTAALPAASIEAMVRRGLSHFFGNEVASKVTAAKQRHVDDKTGNPEGTPLTDDEVKAVRDRFIVEANEKLLAGTVGQHTPRAAVDPQEAEVAKLAGADVRALLSKAGIKAPKKDETVNLKGQEFTFEQLVDRQIARNGDDLNKRAKAILRDKAKAKAARDAAAKSADEAETIEDLGL